MNTVMYFYQTSKHVQRIIRKEHPEIKDDDIIIFCTYGSSHDSEIYLAKCTIDEFPHNIKAFDDLVDEGDKRFVKLNITEESYFMEIFSKI